MNITKGYYFLLGWYSPLTCGEYIPTYTGRIKYVTTGSRLHLEIEVLFPYRVTVESYPWWRLKANKTKEITRTQWLPEEAFQWNPETREEIISCETKS